MSGGRNEEKMKIFFKKLSNDNTIDQMRAVFEENPEIKKYLKGIESQLEDIIGSDETKSFEEIFTELGKSDDEVKDHLEDIVKKTVDIKSSELPEEVREQIFKTWDKVIMENKRKM